MDEREPCSEHKSWRPASSYSYQSQQFTQGSGVYCCNDCPAVGRVVVENFKERFIPYAADGRLMSLPEAEAAQNE